MFLIKKINFIKNKNTKTKYTKLYKYITIYEKLF